MRISQYGLFKLPNWGIKLHYEESRMRLQCEKREMNNLKRKKPGKIPDSFQDVYILYCNSSRILEWGNLTNNTRYRLHGRSYVKLPGTQDWMLFPSYILFLAGLHSFGIQTMFCDGPMPATEIDRGSWVHSWSGETMIDQACLTIGTCEIKHPNIRKGENLASLDFKRDSGLRGNNSSSAGNILPNPKFFIILKWARNLTIKLSYFRKEKYEL